MVWAWAMVESSTSNYSKRQRVLQPTADMQIRLIPDQLRDRPGLGGGLEGLELGLDFGFGEAHFL
jgi:hypothetical protein